MMLAHAHSIVDSTTAVWAAITAIWIALLGAVGAGFFKAGQLRDVKKRLKKTNDRISSLEKFLNGSEVLQEERQKYNAWYPISPKTGGKIQPSDDDKKDDEE